MGTVTKAPALSLSLRGVSWNLLLLDLQFLCLQFSSSFSHSSLPLSLSSLLCQEQPLSAPCPCVTGRVLETLTQTSVLSPVIFPYFPSAPATVWHDACWMPEVTPRVSRSWAYRDLHRGHRTKKLAIIRSAVDDTAQLFFMRFAHVYDSPGLDCFDNSLPTHSL